MDASWNAPCMRTVGRRAEPSAEKTAVSNAVRGDARCPARARIAAMPELSAYAVTAAPTPRRSDDGTMAVLYRAALGPVGAERYLPAFERFDAAGRTLPGWNWAAALCTLSWMVYRQLWGAALVYLAVLEGLALLAVAFGHYAGRWPMPVLAGLAIAVLLAATVLPGLYGHAIVHGEIRKRITKALAASATLAQARERLERHAPTRRRLGMIAAANAVLAMLLAAVLLGPRLPWTGPPSVPSSTMDRPEAEGRSEAPAAPVPPASASAAAPVEDREAPGPGDASAAASRPASAAPAARATSAAASAPAPSPSPPIPTASAAAAATPPASAPAPSAVPAATRSASASAPATPPVPRRAASTAARSPAASAPDRPGAAALRKLYINVGLFAEPANARRAHGMLRSAGLPAATQPVTAADGRQLLRVRAGPFTSTSHANAAAARIRALGLETSAASSQRQ